MFLPKSVSYMHAGEARVWRQCLPQSSPLDFFGTASQSEPELANVARLAVQEALRVFWKSFSRAKMADRTLQQPWPALDGRWCSNSCCHVAWQARYSLTHLQDTQPFLHDRVSPGPGWPCISHRLKESLESWAFCFHLFFKTYLSQRQRFMPTILTT